MSLVPLRSQCNARSHLLEHSAPVFTRALQERMMGRFPNKPTPADFTASTCCDGGPQTRPMIEPLTLVGSPVLYQLNTRVRLAELKRELGRPATLDDIP